MVVYSFLMVFYTFPMVFYQKTHLSHLYLALLLGVLRVAVVVRLDDEEVAAFGVDHELAGGVLQGVGDLSITLHFCLFNHHY